MDDIFLNLGSLPIWPPQAASDEISFEVTEVWLNLGSGKTTTKHRTIDQDGLAAWLASSSQGQDQGSDADALIMRLAWFNVDAKQKLVRLSEGIQNQLIDGFGLKLAYSYARSCLSGATALSPSYKPQVHKRAYTFCNVPKLAAIWSHKRFPAPSDRQPITEGIIFAQDMERSQIKQCLKGKWDTSLYLHPMFLPLMMSIVLGAQIDLTSGDIKKKLRSVESRTGHHYYASRSEDEAAHGVLGSLSAETSGFTTKLASMQRKSKTVDKLLDFVLKMVDEGFGAETAAGAQAGVEAPDTKTDGSSRLTHHVGVLKGRLETQSLDTDYTLKRVQIQVAALQSIITQKDSFHNLQLSKSTHEVAYFSYRDSSSMKTLAVVTMFFLPGSFISALFSTPCFDWDRRDLTSSSVGVPSTPQFTLYWAITIPLTIITFILYFVWLWFQKRKRDRLFHESTFQGSIERTASQEELLEAEGHALAKRRETFLEKTHSKASSFAWNN